jgi:hypothetical protein
MASKQLADSQAVQNLGAYAVMEHLPLCNFGDFLCKDFPGVGRTRIH